MAEVTKREILEIIEHLPNDITLTDALYELYVWAEIEAGLEEARQGRTVPTKRFCGA
jgi:predicted transcriptional regulator